MTEKQPGRHGSACVRRRRGARILRLRFWDTLVVPWLVEGGARLRLGG